MDIKTIMSENDLAKRIELLKKGRKKKLPQIDDFKKQWDVMQHDTMTDYLKLPDKTIQRNGEPITQKVNRIALPLQKKIVNTAVSFAFGNPVILNANPVNNDQEAIMTALQAIGPDAKLNSLSRQSYRELLRSTEVAELWYFIDKGDSNIYGFKSKLKIRCSLFLPFEGDRLYPYFDEYNDMIAFSREFTRHGEDDSTVTYFETYTSTHKYLWKMEGNTWLEAKEPYEHKIGKIPVTYVTQEAVEWADVQNIIDRLEFLLSKFAETNDYHGSPGLFFTGDELEMPEKGEAGKVWKGEAGADVKVISWDKAPESIRLEIETNLRFIYSLTQTPDVSFDSVKGLSAISGVALEMLFMDAHLKVQEKKEILDDYLQRRVNIQKRMIGVIAQKENAADSMSIEPEIVPFKINDETTMINNLVTANGGKPIISQKTAIKALAWVSDADEELKQIKEEEKASSTFDVFEPTND